MEKKIKKGKKRKITRNEIYDEYIEPLQNDKKALEDMIKYMKERGYIE